MTVIERHIPEEDMFPVSREERAAFLRLEASDKTLLAKARSHSCSRENLETLYRLFLKDTSGFTRGKVRELIGDILRGKGSPNWTSDTLL